MVADAGFSPRSNSDQEGVNRGKVKSIETPYYMVISRLYKRGIVL